MKHPLILVFLMSICMFSNTSIATETEEMITVSPTQALLNDIERLHERITHLEQQLNTTNDTEHKATLRNQIAQLTTLRDQLYDEYIELIDENIASNSNSPSI